MNQATVSVNALPISEVLEEAPRIVGPVRDLGSLAGLSKVEFDAKFQQCQFLVVQELTYDDRAIALKGRQAAVIDALCNTTQKVLH